MDTRKKTRLRREAAASGVSLGPSRADPALSGHLGLSFDSGLQAISAYLFALES